MYGTYIHVEVLSTMYYFLLQSILFHIIPLMVTNYIPTKLNKPTTFLACVLYCTTATAILILKCAIYESKLYHLLFYYIILLYTPVNKNDMLQNTLVTIRRLR